MKTTTRHFKISGNELRKAYFNSRNSNVSYSILEYLREKHSLRGAQNFKYEADPYTMGFNVYIKFNILFLDFDWPYEPQWKKNKHLIKKGFISQGNKNLN